jgi:hypothetical protein
MTLAQNQGKGTDNVNRFRVQLELRRRLNKMTEAQFDQIAKDLLETYKDAAHPIAKEVGRSIEEVTAELIAGGVAQRPSNMAWLKKIIPLAPELVAHLSTHFPNEEWLKRAAPGAIRLKKKNTHDYITELFAKRDAGEDRWRELEAKVENGTATYIDRLNELRACAEVSASMCLYAEVAAHPRKIHDAHIREQQLDAMVSMLACLCVPDACTAEPLEHSSPMWSRPAGSDGERFDLAPSADVESGRQ